MGLASVLAESQTHTSTGVDVVASRRAYAREMDTAGHRLAFGIGGVHGIDPKDLTHAPSFAEKVRSRQLRSLPPGASGSATSFCRHFFSPSKPAPRGTPRFRRRCENASKGNVSTGETLARSRFVLRWDSRPCWPKAKHTPQPAWTSWLLGARTRVRWTPQATDSRLASAACTGSTRRILHMPRASQRR